MPFPCFTAHTDRDGLSFLALCSVRRLLNRIHQTVYAAHPGSTHVLTRPTLEASWPAAGFPETGANSVVSLQNLCTELVRQLDTWFESLPDIIRPDLASSSPHNLQDAWLRSRYWSARHIICRPCLIFATSGVEQSQIPSYVVEFSAICVESCRHYIQTASYILERRTQYNWMTIQA